MASTHTRAMASGAYKIIISDLDGTLLDAEHRLGEYTREVLAALRRRGVAIMLASGRHVQDMRTFAAQLGGVDGLISSNGAAVHDGQGQLVQYRALDPVALPFLLLDPAVAQMYVNAYRLDDWIVATPAPHLLQYHRESGFAYRVGDFAALGDAPVLKVFYFHDDTASLHTLERLIRARHGDRLALTYSLPNVLEVMAQGVSKGAALVRALERIGISPIEAIAFGDGRNDLDLLRGVGKGVLMGNAVRELKAALPELEMIGSNAEEAVAHYLARGRSE